MYGSLFDCRDNLLFDFLQKEIIANNHLCSKGTVELGGKNISFSQNCLLLTFGETRVREGVIAHFNAVIIYFFIFVELLTNISFIYLHVC